MRQRIFIVVIFIGVLLLSLAGRGADWPMFRGPSHNGITQETAWSHDWGTNGPPVVWRAEVGVGFSSFAVVEGRIYTMGHNGNKDNTLGRSTVYCFDNEGRTLWSYSYVAPLHPKLFEGGALCTPTVDQGRVYVVGNAGLVFCLDAMDGREIWKKDLCADLGYALPSWMLSGSALVIDDVVYLNAGTAGTALNKQSGELIWSNGKQICGYATPVPLTIDNTPSLAIFGKNKLFCVVRADGRLLWEIPWQTRYDINAADPVVVGKQLYLSSDYSKGCALYDITLTNATEVWFTKTMRNHMSSPLLWQNYLYGFDDTRLTCLRLRDGERIWREKDLGKGSLMMSSDGRMILLSDKGELVIALADPAGYKPVARAAVLPENRCWTAPVLANGHIYCRNAPGNVVCVKVGD